ncbi:unnamed protein product [Fusarium venenatum]|uniref:Uncharacterized protein n=1 Tax=Fusarium venenatum TaxID=56646 RepID=A0A2L2TTV9_9HYPO|nr:uncharacterized protein FVRRES_09094 [Fusarium venenatum]CEI69017.1 unnamed protein product [Fusarium venenatum]
MGRGKRRRHPAVHAIKWKRRSSRDKTIAGFAKCKCKNEEPESWGFTAGGSEARRNGEDPSADEDGKQPISTSSHVLNGRTIDHPENIDGDLAMIS